jgi:hypothetical protein
MKPTENVNVLLHFHVLEEKPEITRVKWCDVR